MIVPAIIFIPEKSISIGSINLYNVISEIPVLIDVIIHMHLYPFTYLRKVKQFIKTNCVHKKKIIARDLSSYKGNSVHSKVFLNSHYAFQVSKWMNELFSLMLLF